MAGQTATAHTTHLQTKLDVFMRYLVRNDSELNGIQDLPKNAYDKVFLCHF